VKLSWGIQPPQLNAIDLNKRRNQSMITGKPVALLVCAAAAVALLVCNTQVQSQPQSAHIRLGGTFVGNGASGLWTSTAAPLDPAGQKSTVRIYGVAMPGFVPLMAALQADTFTEMVGQQELVSQKTAKYRVIGYPTQGPTIKAIFEMTGLITFETQNKCFVTYTLNVFAPTADANQDGLPDPGSTPIIPPIEGGDYAKRVAP
jgi:hypothetical protein